MYDFFECCTVRLYHFGKVCKGFGFWFLVCFFSSKVNTIVGVGITSTITAAFGVGVGDSSSYSKGVPGAIKSSCSSSSEAVSVAGYSSIGCGGSILEVAGVVVVVAVVTWISIGFKRSLYEGWVMVLDSSIFIQECTIVGNSFVC